MESMAQNNVLITGGTGFVGSALAQYLRTESYRVSLLSRKPANDNRFQWHPDDKIMDKNALIGIDTIVHLAGETLFDKRWSKKRKAYILNNRRNAAETLVQTILASESQPNTVVVASAVGFYGDRGDEILTEKSGSGNDFPSEVCRVIENAFAPLAKIGVRVVFTRFGIVLGKEGGALKKMLLPFQLGLGGKMGTGQQIMSWIQLNDCIRAIKFLIETPTLDGIFNLTSPEPATNLDFSKALAHQVNRPCFFPLPDFIIKLAFGEMGESLLLSSAKVIPQRLMDYGFQFQSISIVQAFKNSFNST